MSKKSVTINKKCYKVKEIDFGAVCELEENGLSFTELDKYKRKPFTLFRACFAFHSGLDLASAGKEIEEHLINGGTFNDFQPFVDAIAESDFFKKMAEKQANN